MEEFYSIYDGEKQVGKAQVSKEGLYITFCCWLQTVRHQVFRLWVCWDGGKCRLGVPSPRDDGFYLQTKIPAKHIKTPFTIQVMDGEIHPQSGNGAEPLQSKKGDGGVFVPLSPEEPFAYLERLKDGFLRIQNGKTGIFFPEKEHTETEGKLQTGG